MAQCLNSSVPCNLYSGANEAGRFVTVFEKLEQSMD